MKSIFLPMLLLGTLASAQDPAPRVLISPDKPAAGDRITVTYRTEKAPTEFKTARSLTLDVLLVARGGYPDGELREYPMEKSGSRWSVSFSIDNPAARLLVFRFVTGEKADDDGDNVWAAMMYTRAGIPVQGAHFALSALYRYGIGSFKRKQDPAMMGTELALELSLYPDNWDAVNADWSGALATSGTDSLRAAIREKLNTFVEKNLENDSLLAQFPNWYERIGDSAKAKEIRAYGTSRVPHGYVAYDANMSAYAALRDPAEKVKMLQQALSDMGPTIDQQKREAHRAQIAYLGIIGRQFDAAIDALNGAARPQWSLYSRLALALSKTGARPEEAKQFARRGAELAAIADPETRKYFKTRREWEESNGDARASALRTLGEVLASAPDIKGAVSAFHDAYVASNGGDADIDLEYVESLAMDRQFSRAVDVGFETVKKGKSTDSLLADVKRYYAVAAGGPSFDSLPDKSRREFEKRLAGARKEMAIAIRARVLKSRISMPCPDFTLKTTGGTSVQRSSLTGKVVVIDFWATWCGPCRMSFPFLQKVYEKYNTNPRVAIYAIDCWENKIDFTEAANNATKFLKANNYTWPVLVDARDEVVSRFVVEGIPTKFIIDPAGNIAFKSVGYDGPDMEEELTQQIEVLLADSKK